MSIKKREGSTSPWQVIWRDPSGKQRYRQFSRKGDAEKFETEIKRAKQLGNLDALDAGTQPLWKIGEEFFNLYKGEWEATSTAKGYAYLWNSTVLGESKYPRAEIADLPVRAIRKSHVQQFKVDALADGVPVSSVARALSLITRALDHAADESMIAANPAARVKSPKPEDRPPVIVLVPEQVEKIRKKLDARDAALVSVLAYAGLRPHELRALTPAHLGKANLDLRASVKDDGTLKGLKARVDGKRLVPVCSALADDLAGVAWGSTYLVENANGGPWTKTDWSNWRRRRFLPAAEAAGIEVNRPYELRHSIASLWFRQGIDTATVADRLGHSVAVLQSTYLHVLRTLDPSDRRSVDEMIAEARAT